MTLPLDTLTFVRSQLLRHSMGHVAMDERMEIVKHLSRIDAAISEALRNKPCPVCKRPGKPYGESMQTVGKPTFWCVDCAKMFE